MNSLERKRKLEARRTRAHHLWEMSKDGESGNLRIKRKRSEGDVMSKKSSNGVERKNISAAYWGLFGASLVDDATLTNSIPNSIANRFNIVANKVNLKACPKIYNWDELRRAFGAEYIDDIRKNITYGVRTRTASKYLNIPYLVAAEIVYNLGTVDANMKAAFDLVKRGYKKEALTKYGKVAIDLSNIIDEYRDPESRKLAVDEAARQYWQMYAGPFGKELVREVKKRVRADAARMWLKKHGVDEAAAEYWSSYYGKYGEDWVSVVPKMISPAND